MNTSENTPKEVAFDLFETTIPKKKPRIPKIKGCAADAPNESARKKFIDRVSQIAEIEHKRHAIDRHRAEVKEKIAELRKQKAGILGRSKKSLIEKTRINATIAELRLSV